MTRKKYIEVMTSPLKFKLAMLFKLPSALFWGMRIQKLNLSNCEVAIPYRWSTKNPFRSIYFAALAGAGELATGALAQLSLCERGAFSMLVVDFKAEFVKKAETKIVFSCNQGEELNTMLNNLKESGDSDRITLLAEGKNKHGETIGKMHVTWSFKKKG
jgi:hypothetical protein